MFRKFLAILLTIFAVAAAGWLALRRPDIPYDTLEYTYTVPHSNFVTLGDEVKIHFADTGPRDAPVVVLLHGFAASLHTWSHWQAKLDDNYRVISLDLPGHGLSRVPENEAISIDYYVETVDALMDRLDVDRFSLAGSSMGGNVAWQYALQHPDKLDGLVLVDAAGWARSGEESDDAPLVFKLLRVPVARLLMKDLDLSSLIESGLRDSFADQTLVTEAMAERYAALSRAPGHRDALLSLAAGNETREKASRERLSAINVPTLILWGDKDNLIPVSHASRFEDAIPNAIVTIYKNVGHIPQEEQADQSAADMAAFLDRYADAPLTQPATAISDTASPGASTGGGLRPR